jgi:hypothetical protein
MLSSQNVVGLQIPLLYFCKNIRRLCRYILYYFHEFPTSHHQLLLTLCCALRIIHVTHLLSHAHNVKKVFSCQKNIFRYFDGLTRPRHP